MEQQRPHESSLRKDRWSWPNHCYFVTANAANKLPLFADPSAAQIVVDSLEWLQRNGRIRLMGFVVMPDHLHVAFVLGDGESRPEGRSHNSVARIMDSFKGYTGKKINELLKRHGEVWQPAYHDHLVRDRKDFETRLAYMHANPIRKSLVHFEHEYEWSSANPKSAHLIDWAWLDGIQAGRARKGAPTGNPIG